MFSIAEMDSMRARMVAAVIATREAPTGERCDNCKSMLVTLAIANAWSELAAAIVAINVDIAAYGLHHPDGSSPFWTETTEVIAKLACALDRADAAVDS